MRLLDSPMSPECILKSLAAFGGAFLLLLAGEVRAQTGPTVQVFTSGNASGGGATFMPLERLPVAVSVSVSSGFDTNVGTSAGGKQSSFYTAASIGLTYSFGSERTRATVSWGTGLSYYANGAGGGFNEYQPDTSLNLSLSHLVSERLTLNSGIYAHYGIEPDFFTAAGENRRSGNYFYTADSLTASYQWLERVSTVTSYSIGVLMYTDEPLSTLLNRYDHGFSQQLRVLVLPTTTVFGQYGFSLATYDVGDRNSYSNTFSLGFSQTVGPRTQFSFSGGAQLYSSDLDNSEVFGPYMTTSLSFVVGEKTNLNWSAQYSTQEANIVSASSRKSFGTGLQLNYAITPRIGSNLSVYYSHSENQGQELLFFDPERFVVFAKRPVFSEDSFDFGLSLTYSITPRLTANAGAHYTEVSSDLATRPYARARFSGGLGYSF